MTFRRGIVPVVPLEEAERGEDRFGRTHTFSYTTDVPSYLRNLRLTYRDRSRIVAAILGTFMDPPDWERVREARGGRAF